jgi:hypothetical protein
MKPTKAESPRDCLFIWGPFDGAVMSVDPVEGKTIVRLDDCDNAYLYTESGTDRFVYDAVATIKYHKEKQP